MTDGPGRSRRDAGVTALVQGFFAASWFGWGMAAAAAGLQPWLTIGCIVGFVSAAAGAILGFRSPHISSALHDRNTRRRYSITVGIEFGVAAIGAGILAPAGESDFIPVWVCAVVAVHFYPLANILRDPLLIPLGTLMCAVAGTALALALTTDIAASTVTGVGAGCSLLAFALISLVNSATASDSEATDDT